MTKIPVSKPLLDGNEQDYVLRCLQHGWLSSSGDESYVPEFEKKMAKQVDRKYGIAVSSGTAALQVAVEALRLEPKSEVILPNFTIISCALAVVRAGLTPVYIDADENTWNMDIKQIESKIRPGKTKAIMVAHIYGLPVEMDRIIELAKKYDLKVIEDCAEQIGQTYNGKKCGSFGDISIMSFYPNKHVTTGEGGMVLTDDKTLAERSQSLRNLCFDEARRYIHEELGYNFRMTNLQAALGVAQLESLDRRIETKRAIGYKYTQLLKDIDGIQLPVPETNYAKNIYWVYGIVLKESISRNAVEMISALEKEGISSRHFFWPLHDQPCLREFKPKNEEFPVSKKLAERGLYIPSGPKIEDSDIQTVVKVLKRNLK